MLNRKNDACTSHKLKPELGTRTRNNVNVAILLEMETLDFQI